MRQSEKGFMLIELAVVVALTAILTLGAGMSVVQIITGSQRNEDGTTVVRQAQNVGYRVSHDALMAQTITIGDDPGTGDVEFIVLKWKDWESGETHEMSYIWLDSADSLKKLKKRHIVCDRDGVETGNTLTMVADNIYAASLSEQDGLWSLSVEARSGDKSAIRTYEINKRLEDE